MTVGVLDIEYLSNFIASRSGNVVPKEKAYLIESRLLPVLQETGLADIETLIGEMRRRPGGPLHDRVAEAMTINETSFFRDIEPFHRLRDDVIPELIKTRANAKTLSIWCAASSSGQEPYSIAMLLREHFPELNTWNVRITATDYSDAMVKRTQTGVYSQFEVNRGLPAPMLIKHFTRKGMEWHANDNLKSMIHCRRLNLVENLPVMPRFDIVFLRNVLIYFDKPVKQRIAKHIHQVMQPDGWLFLGGGETFLGMDVPFRQVSLGKIVCFQPTK